MSGRMRSTVSRARFSSAPGHVKLMSVMPSFEMFWMIMSTLTLLPANAENTFAATPVMSGTPRMVNFTSDVSWAMPVMTASSIMSVSSLI